MLYFLLLLSGAAALIYEIAWSRQIGLLFGHSVHAAAVVLAATFAGMALGYFVAGGIAQKLRRPLRGYAIAELIVAAWAVATPFLIDALAHPTVAAWLHHSDPQWRVVLRGVATFVILLPATLALGSTLPFVAQHLARIAEPTGRPTTRAYAANTLGAVGGVLLATFVLILLLGVRGSGWTAAGLSAFAGLLAWMLAARTPLPPLADADRSPEISSTNSRVAPRWIVLAMLSGAGTLGVQVLYTRLFALVFHNSTYTFGLVVAAFLIALAVGSVLVAWRNPRPGDRGLATALALGGMALPISLMLFLLVSGFQLTSYVADLGGKPIGFGPYMVRSATLVAVVILPPVVAMGMLLPWCWSVAAQTAGRTVGQLSAWNTMAAAVGAIVTSFVLLPQLGLWNSFALWSGFYLATALWQSWVERSQTALALACIGGLLIPFSLSSLSRNDRTAADGDVLVQRWETSYGWIDVVERPSNKDKRLVQDLHYGFGSVRSARNMVRMGRLPLLLHPEPQRLLFLGLATGTTSSAALLDANIQQIDIVELIPEVQEAARHFQEVNGGVLDDPRTRVHLDDARHFLVREQGPWDVIVSDLFVPWHSHAGYLYTVEHYRAARERLAPGGLFCQWLPMWQLGEREFRLIANSFADVFPSVSVWRSDTGTRPFVALIGAESTISLESQTLNARLARQSAHGSPADRQFQNADRVFGMWIGDWPRGATGRLNTDEHPRLEFLAPVTHVERRLLGGGAFEAFRQRVLDQQPRAAVERDGPTTRR